MYTKTTHIVITVALADLVRC